MARMSAKRQGIARRQHHFHLDPINEARLARMKARYQSMLGCDVSLSLLLPRALMALEKELDAFLPTNTATDHQKALRDSERQALAGLCP